MVLSRNTRTYLLILKLDSTPLYTETWKISLNIYKNEQWKTKWRQNKIWAWCLHDDIWYTDCNSSSTSSSKNCRTGNVKPGMFNIAQLPEISSITTHSWYLLLQHHQGKWLPQRPYIEWHQTTKVGVGPHLPHTGFVSASTAMGSRLAHPIATPLHQTLCTGSSLRLKHAINLA